MWDSSHHCVCDPSVGFFTPLCVWSKFWVLQTIVCMVQVLGSSNHCVHGPSVGFLKLLCAWSKCWVLETIVCVVQVLGS